MKRLKLLGIALLVFIGVVGVSDKVNVKSAQASVLKTTTVPKRFRGTWYLATSRKKVHAYKINSTRIKLDGVNARVYKYSSKAYRATSLSIPSKVLISSKGNTLTFYYIGGRIYPLNLSSNHQSLRDASAMQTYYKSKSAALKHYRR
ncbi:hypothetical protein FP435_03455 [Lactobacillus sp. PV037]|uniref:hypothetical protein n=1 Tax=unclassified Lactobacillus TaxID=2620435 RepID=UPI00223FBEF7|nr:MULTISPECIES: hypothetical protein [unclassified Lactobacillus]QNQ82323.1 hypothetical protein FP433_04375 [Lactobacillus sp. PV012]QNQ83565.1 hypothetical protein FP435_03455 [Lactobacillus sp. PV037]